MMDRRLRSWIVDVLEQHRSLLNIAVRQRAKFEGWLKFELARYAEEHGATGVEVEAPSDSGGRSDLSFTCEGNRYDVELKTCNTNYRMPGVLDCTRPITKNIASVVDDGHKLRLCHNQGIVAFCLFPAAPSSPRLPTSCWSAASVPVRPISRPVLGLRPGRADRSKPAAVSACQSAPDADREADRPAQAGVSALGRAEDPRASTAPVSGGHVSRHQHRPRRPRPPWSGDAPKAPPLQS